MELRDYLRILRRRWTLIVGCIVAALAVATLVTVRATPQYASNARIFISTGSASASDDGSRQQPVPERSGGDPEGHVLRAAGHRRRAGATGHRQDASRPHPGAALAQDQGAGGAGHGAAQGPGRRRRPEDGAGDQQAGRLDPPRPDQGDRDRPRQEDREPQGHRRRPGHPADRPGLAQPASQPLPRRHPRPAARPRASR